MITAIFFDLFGVLLGIDQSVVVQYLSNLTEVPYLKTREIVMGEPFMRLERGEVKFSKYVDEIRKVLPNGSRIEKNILKEMWMNAEVGEMPAISLLRDLLANYQVWVISNTSEKHIKILQTKFAFLNHVNGIVTSERAGAYKPNPEIYQFALSEAHVDVLSSVFIDDSSVNVESAKNVGIISHHYVGYDQLMVFLKQNM